MFSSRSGRVWARRSRSSVICHARRPAASCAVDSSAESQSTDLSTRPLKDSRNANGFRGERSLEAWVALRNHNTVKSQTKVIAAVSAKPFFPQKISNNLDSRPAHIKQSRPENKVMEFIYLSRERIREELMCTSSNLVLQFSTHLI